MSEDPNDAFSAWVDSVEELGRRAIGRSDTDMTWYIGGIEDMRRGFQEGMSATEYVKAQIDAWASDE